MSTTHLSSSPSLSSFPLRPDSSKTPSISSCVSHQSCHDPSNLGYMYELGLSGLYIKCATHAAGSKRVVSPQDLPSSLQIEQAEALEVVRKILILSLYMENPFPEYNSESQYVKGRQFALIKEALITVPYFADRSEQRSNLSRHTLTTLLQTSIKVFRKK